MTAGGDGCTVDRDWWLTMVNYG